MRQPPESRALVGISWALFVTYTVLSVGMLVGWRLLRREPRLHDKSFPVAISLSLGCFLGYLVIALKRAVVDPTTMHPIMPCATFAWLYIPVAPLLASANIVVLMRRILLMRRQAMAGLINRRNSLEDTRSSIASASTSVRPPPRTFARFAVDVFTFVLGKEDIVAGSEHEAERKLMLVNDAVSDSAQVLFFAALFLPSALLCAFVLGTTPLYTSGCVGCDITWELVIVILSTIVLTLPVRYVLWRRLLLVASEDAVFLREMRLYTATMLTSLVGTTILLAFDPARADYLYIFPWEFFLLAAITVQWCVVVVRHVVAAFWQRRERLRHINVDVLSSAHYAVGGVLRHLDNEGIMEAFEAFCESKFTVEHLKFIFEVQHFADVFNERSPVWRQRQAHKIAKVYVLQGAMLQVNLSSANRTKIEYALAQEQPVAANLFEHAFREVVRMVNNDAWFEFVQSKRFEDAARANAKSSLIRVLSVRHAESVPRVGDAA